MIQTATSTTINTTKPLEESMPSTLPSPVSRRTSASGAELPDQPSARRRISRIRDSRSEMPRS